MLEIYIFFLALKILASITCAATAYMVAQKHVTPTGTYMLMCWAFVIIVFLQVLGLFGAMSVAEFLSKFDRAWVVFTQLLSSIAFLLLLTALIRKLAAIKAIGLK